MLLAAKLLASVEVSSKASNQHEINAGNLRKALNLPEGSSAGRFDLTYLDAGDGDPEVEASTYTMYNSREGKPRPAEYRLYYHSTSLQEKASPGDILIILRSEASPDLRGLVVSRDSKLGSTVAAVLAEEGIEIDDRFKRVGAAISGSALAHLLDDASEAEQIPDSQRIVSELDPVFLAKVLADNTMPPTKHMAVEAQRIFAGLFPGRIDADAHLFWVLQVETAIFQHLERQLGQVALDALVQDGRVQFDAAVALVMGKLQSRKSRRGTSLQNHLAVILDRNGISYTAQCTTDGKERPDFVLPSCASYHDPSFPDSRLRMIACKSVVKERWRQVLPEADRVLVKYLLTVDPSLTDDTLRAMTNSGLRTFIPLMIADEHYTGRSGRGDLHSIEDLMEALRNA